MRLFMSALFFALLPLVARGAVLEVGPGKDFARLEAALAKARPGDEIVVSPRAKNAPYEKTALQITTARLTIRSADPEKRIPLSGEGFDYAGVGSTPRAIVQFNPGADGCTLEGFELSGARNGSDNGAGVRINQANNITIRRCKIFGNDMGIMSNGNASAKPPTPPTAANQLIEGCLISDNGTDKSPGYNHNLYLGGTSVTVRACEIARSVTGHNLKSRAHLNLIEYNWIHDSVNRECDFVDEEKNTDIPDSNTILLGNFIVKAAKMSGNKTVIHFGKDGKADHTGTLFLIHNTIVTAFISPVADLSSPGASAVFINNLIDDGKAKQAGQVLVVARDPKVLQLVHGEGNSFAETFLAKLPAAVKAGDLVIWDKIEMPALDPLAPPDPAAKRPALLHFLSVGKLEERKEIAAGAGPLPAKSNEK